MARGRMLNRSVCASLKFHKLSDDTARLIATWLIPHLDMRGVFYGDPGMVRSLIMPRRSDIPIEKVRATLAEMETVGLIELFQHNGDIWQHWRGFADNQAGLRPDREKTDFPDPAATLPDSRGNCAASLREIRGDDGGVNEMKLNETKGNETKGNEEKGNEEKGIAGANAPPAKANLNKHEAIQAYRDAAHLYPPGSWKQKVIDAVGDGVEDIAFWHEVVIAYVGLGWSPKNVKVMLEHYERREIPSIDRKQGKDEPASLDVIREWVGQEGVI